MSGQPGTLLHGGDVALAVAVRDAHAPERQVLDADGSEVVRGQLLHRRQRLDGASQVEGDAGAAYRVVAQQLAKPRPAGDVLRPRGEALARGTGVRDAVKGAVVVGRLGDVAHELLDGPRLPAGTPQPAGQGIRHNVAAVRRPGCG